MHDNGTQTIKAEVVEPIVETQETCREEANTSSSYSPSPRTVYTCNDGKVSPTRPHHAFTYKHRNHELVGFSMVFFRCHYLLSCLLLCFYASCIMLDCLSATKPYMCVCDILSVALNPSVPSLSACG